MIYAVIGPEPWASNFYRRMVAERAFKPVSFPYYLSPLDTPINVALKCGPSQQWALECMAYPNELTIHAHKSVPIRGSNVKKWA